MSNSTIAAPVVAPKPQTVVPMSAPIFGTHSVEHGQSSAPRVPVVVVETPVDVESVQISMRIARCKQLALKHVNRYPHIGPNDYGELTPEMLSDGLPEAERIIELISTKWKDTDPYLFHGSLAKDVLLAKLNSRGIYGNDICKLFNEVCGKSVSYVVVLICALTRPVSMLLESTIWEALEPDGEKLDFPDMISGLLEYMPKLKITGPLVSSPASVASDASSANNEDRKERDGQKS